MADRKPVGKARLTRRSFVIAAAASGGGFALGFHLGAQAQGVQAAAGSAYTATVDSGPLAVVGLSDHVEMTFRRFVNVSPSKRPAALFKTEAEARAWLAMQPPTPKTKGN